MSNDTDPPESKLTRSKQRWAREGKFLTGRITRPEDQRLPPGQHLTKDWPVLDLGLLPNVTRERWRLDVYGAVEQTIYWDWPQFTAQPQTQFVSDIHCVTTWSRYDNQWEGLATRDLLAVCQPREDARFVVLHSYDGYTTNLPLEDFAAEDALLAHSWSGQPLERALPLVPACELKGCDAQPPRPFVAVVRRVAERGHLGEQPVGRAPR